MKNILIAAALCAASIVPATAQAPAAAPAAAAQGTNELALTAISHFKAVFNHAASADNEENAKKAAAGIQAELAKLTALKPLLEKAKAPTDAEMAAMANKMAGFEAEMKVVMGKMMKNMMAGGQPVQQALEPAMKKFGQESQEIGKLMEGLYPEEKMKPLIEAAKAKLEEKKGE